MTWPPRWTGSNFKHDQPNRRVEERKEKLKVASLERLNKAFVRKRDKKCRFPLCGCKLFRRHAHVSHREHKGPGGDPKGLRSDTDNMVLLCPFRHLENRVSIHQGNLQWDPLTKIGANGPIVWRELHGKAWIVLARETSIGSWEPFTDSQRVRLERLAEMDI